MVALLCERCNGNSFDLINGYRVCSYCGTRYLVDNQELLQSSTSISLGEDIQNLLEKCRLDPANAKKYANLILDIDPSNLDVYKYLK